MKKASNGFMKSLRYVCLMGVISLGLMSIISTGGGGGHDSHRTTIGDLVGAYDLSAFTIVYDSGLIITQKDVDSFSGTMVVLANGKISQTLVVNGVVGYGQGTILSVGRDTIRIYTPGCTYDLYYKLEGNILTTTAPSGTCGSNFREVDVWRKISNSASLANAAYPVPEETQELEKTIIGGTLGRIWDFLP